MTFHSAISPFGKFRLELHSSLPQFEYSSAISALCLGCGMLQHSSGSPRPNLGSFLCYTLRVRRPMHCNSVSLSDIVFRSNLNKSPFRNLLKVAP